MAETKYSHHHLADCPGRGMFTIAFVRHPWNWWKSYWAYKRRTKWDLKNHFDLQCMHNEFEPFLLNVLRLQPGYCSRLFTKFTGPLKQEINFVGRHENLVEDLITVLHRVAEPFDEQALRDTQGENRSNYETFVPTCSNEVRLRIFEAEAEAIRRFGYASKLTDSDLDKHRLVDSNAANV